MDPLIAKLNSAIASQIETPKAFAQAPQLQNGETSGFQSTLDNKLTERLMDSIMGDSIDSGQMKTLSAENIHVETETSDIARGSKIDSTDSAFDMFKTINRDMLSLDNAIETLTSGVKLKPQQLLALQAGVSNVSIQTEAFSKLTGAVASGIQSLVQTQV